MTFPVLHHLCASLEGSSTIVHWIVVHCWELCLDQDGSCYFLPTCMTRETYLIIYPFHIFHLASISTSLIPSPQDVSWGHVKLGHIQPFITRVAEARAYKLLTAFKANPITRRAENSRLQHYGDLKGIYHHYGGQPKTREVTECLVSST